MQNRSQDWILDSTELRRGTLGGRACLGTGQHRGGEDLLQDLRYILGVHGNKGTACRQGSLESTCQRK